MSQWGDARSFTKGEVALTVIPHVATAGFGPARSASLIDDLALLHIIRGDMATVTGILDNLRERFVGRAYRDWLEDN